MNSGFADPRATWDQRFARDEYIFGTAPNVFLAAQRERLQPGRRALCVADGEGRNSVWLAEQGLQVTAFDIAPRGVAKARAGGARRRRRRLPRRGGRRLAVDARRVRRRGGDLRAVRRAGRP